LLDPTTTRGRRSGSPSPSPIADGWPPPIRLISLVSHRARTGHESVRRHQRSLAYVLWLRSWSPSSSASCFAPEPRTLMHLYNAPPRPAVVSAASLAAPAQFPRSAPLHNSKIISLFLWQPA
jgi:hypothetical protein